MKSDDYTLIKKLKKGDQTAFSALYKKYWEKLYYTAYLRLNSREETEDILHDLFIDLWNKRESIEIKKNFQVYLFTALKYKIFRLIDAKTVRRKYIVNERSQNSSNIYDLQKHLDLNDIFDQIEQKVEMLPTKCKIIFKLSRYKNYSIKEISKKLNISPNTTQNHITKALKYLRSEMNDFLLVILFIFFS